MYKRRKGGGGGGGGVGGAVLCLSNSRGSLQRTYPVKWNVYYTLYRNNWLRPRES